VNYDTGKCEFLSRTVASGVEPAEQCGVHHRIRVRKIPAEVMAKIDAAYGQSGAPRSGREPRESYDDSKDLQ